MHWAHEMKPSSTTQHFVPSEQEVRRGPSEQIRPSRRICSWLYEKVTFFLKPINSLVTSARYPVVHAHVFCVRRNKSFRSWGQPQILPSNCQQCFFVHVMECKGKFAAKLQFGTFWSSSIPVWQKVEREGVLFQLCQSNWREKQKHIWRRRHSRWSRETVCLTQRPELPRFLHQL